MRFSKTFKSEPSNISGTRPIRRTALRSTALDGRQTADRRDTISHNIASIAASGFALTVIASPPNAVG